MLPNNDPKNGNVVDTFKNSEGFVISWKVVVDDCVLDLYIYFFPVKYFFEWIFSAEVMQNDFAENHLYVTPSFMGTRLFN